MSHEIMETKSGEFAMAYRDGDPVPWHASETNPQTFAPAAEPQEILEAARLNFEVQLKENCFSNGSPIPDSFHISRVDEPETVLGRFVAGDWQPVQNSKLLELAGYIERTQPFKIITAGALFGGSKIFVQLESSESFTLPGNDKVVNRLLSTVSHLGNEANKFIGCNTRVVCENTAAAASSERAGIITHDHRVELDFDAVSTAIGLTTESFGEFSELAQRMAVRALTDAEALNYFRTVLGGREKLEENGRVRHSVAVRKAMAAHNGQEFVAIGKADAADVALEVSDRLEQISRNVAAELPRDSVTQPSPVINPGHDMESTRGTLWGAFNTVTWLADHQPIKNRGVDFNLASNLLGAGTGGKIKAKAQKAASELLAA